jgi:hypothetical protein
VAHWNYVSSHIVALDYQLTCHVLCRMRTAEAEMTVGTAHEMPQRDVRESSSSASAGLLVNNDYRSSEVRGTFTTHNGYLAPPPRLLTSPPLLPCPDQSFPGTSFPRIMQDAETSVETLVSYKSPSHREIHLPAIEGGWI